MGYDISLHAVDEKAIKSEFLPWIMGKAPCPPSFAERYSDHEEIYNIFIEAMAGSEEDPYSAARTMTELAVMYAACNQPHIQERGVGFSLAHYPDNILNDLPDDLAEGPGEMLAPFLAEHPELAEYIPIYIEENYMTGVYIPAAKIKALRSWQEKLWSKFDEGTKATYSNIERLIAYAAENGFGLWEATDLDLCAPIPLPEQLLEKNTGWKS